MLKLIALTGLLLMASLGNFVHAGESGEWEKGLFVGTSLGAQTFFATSLDDFDPALNIDLIAGYDFFRRLAVQARSMQAIASDQGTTALFYGFTVGLKFSPLNTRISPYASSGVGFHIIHAKTNLNNVSLSSTRDPAFKFDAGLGSDFYLTGRNVIYGEVIYHGYPNGADRVRRNLSTGQFEDIGDSYFSGLSFSLGYRFVF